MDREEGERRRPPSWSSDDDQANRAEDRGFEPLRAINPTRFPSERHRPLGESSAGRLPAGGERSARPRTLVTDPRAVSPSLNPPRAGRQQG